MGRFRGSFLNSANYEPLIAAPFDAREKVDYRSDLIAESTWQQTNGAKYIYDGMVVSVTKDLPMFNGRYFLIDRTKFNSYESWIKLANENQIVELQKQIDELRGGSSPGSVDAVKKELDEYIVANNQRVSNIETILGKPSSDGILATGLHLKVESLEQTVNIATKTIFDILAGIGGEGQPATVLEAIKTISYELPIASAAALGGIKSASDIVTNDIIKIATNKVYVDPNTGIGEVKQISTDILVNGEEELVFFGGSSL